MHRWCGILIIVAVAAACSSSSGSDPDLEAWTREVRVLTPAQVGNRDYDQIAALEEQESIGTQSEAQAISIAKDRLRRAAARLDADAVVVVDCGSNVRPMDEMSRRSMVPAVICQGVAIRWRSR
jgi:uncharacterized protein YbjQ (UPF0145 family)